MASGPQRMQTGGQPLLHMKALSGPKSVTAGTKPDADADQYGPMDNQPQLAKQDGRAFPTSARAFGFQ